MLKSKILVLDIETRPAKVYTFRMWDVNFTPDHIIEDGGVLCVGAHWLGTNEYFFFSEWEHGQREMLLHVYELLEDADAVVTYNGDKFDLPKLRGEFLLMGFDDHPPLTSIDLIKTVKKLGFEMNRLAYIGPLLKIGAKVKNEGLPLWSAVLDGNVRAQNRMKRYCLGDVKLTTRLYERVKPYIRNHPHLGENKGQCGSCGSDKLHSRGYRRTKYFSINRLQCQSCGSWQDGQRKKI